MSEASAVEFSNEAIDFICAVEQAFWLHGQLPTNEKVNELTGITLKTIEGYWKNQGVRDALMKRGVDLDTSRSKALLNIQQLTLANMLLNFADNRSLREKLNQVGVSSQQYHAWLRQEAFRDYLARRAEDLFKSSDHEAYMSLMGAVRDGDMKGLQLFFEMRGIYNPKQTVEIHIESVMVRVIEVISKHIKDPEVLNAIADDLEIIEIGSAGGQPINMPVLDLPLPVESNQFTI